VSEREKQVAPDEFVEAIAEQDAARPTPSDLKDAIPDEFAVETIVPARGKNWPAEKRVDYRRIRIHNADGTLNKTGKNLVELHRPQARIGGEINERLREGDFAPKPKPKVEELRFPLSAAAIVGFAARAGLVPGKGHCIGQNDVFGIPNLWRDKAGKLVRVIAIGESPLSVRIETYPV
jgi:hypothetical protein